MNVKTNKVISLMLTVLMLVGVITCHSSVAGAVTGTLSKNTSKRHTICTSLSTQAKAYYTGNYTYSNLSNLSGGSSSGSATMDSNLYKTLNTLMTDTMTDSVTYKSLTTYFPDTDADNGSDNASMIYGDATTSSSYSREHVWPKSKASFKEKNGGCDIHHLRPENSTINSTRNCYTFGNVQGVLSTYTTKQYEGSEVLYYSASDDRVEVKDNVKGDVARILLYVYVRWQEPNLFEETSTPVIGESDDQNTGERVIESLDTLLEWCEIDPVDQWEMTRNDQCENIQGNRNVFIDYPEFAWTLFGKSVPSSYATPTSGGSSTTTTTTTTTATTATTATTNTTATTVATESTTVATVSTGNLNVGTYALNKSSKKIHISTCSSVPTIKATNLAYHTGSIDTLVSSGYTTCGSCMKAAATYYVNKNTKKIHIETCSSTATSTNIVIYMGLLSCLTDNGYTACGNCKAGVTTTTATEATTAQTETTQATVVTEPTEVTVPTEVSTTIPTETTQATATTVTTATTQATTETVVTEPTEVTVPTEVSTTVPTETAPATVATITTQATETTGRIVMTEATEATTKLPSWITNLDNWWSSDQDNSNINQGETGSVEIVDGKECEKGHDYGTGVVVKKSTYFAKGKELYTCANCGATYTLVTAKLKLATPKVNIAGGKKKMTVKYTKVADATGFQVKYKINGKTVKKSFNTTASAKKVIKKLAKGSYKVQVRAFVKQNSKTAYSKWTKVKTVKVK